MEQTPNPANDTAADPALIRAKDHLQQAIAALDEAGETLAAARAQHAFDMLSGLGPSDRG